MPQASQAFAAPRIPHRRTVASPLDVALSRLRETAALPHPRRQRTLHSEAVLLWNRDNSQSLAVPTSLPEVVSRFLASQLPYREARTPLIPAWPRGDRRNGLWPC